MAMIDERSCCNAQVGARWPVNPANRRQGGTFDGAIIVHGSDSSGSFYESAIPREVDPFPQKPRENTAEEKSYDSTA